MHTAIQTKYPRSFQAMCLMLFFWTLFDGIVSYVTPLKISQAGFSDAALGLIIGFSSVAGGVFDFLLSKFLTNTHFRRIYLFLFLFSFVYPLLLWQAKTVWLFLVAMVVWGIYYDLINFGSFDFVAREVDHTRHAAGFGFLSVFKELGYMLAPLFAGFVLGVSSLVDWKPFALMMGFITISFTFFLIVRLLTKKEKHYLPVKTYKPIRIGKELSIWRKISVVLLPPLLISMLFAIYDSFFWTLGPLLAQSYHALSPFNGIFLVVYSLPFLFVGLFVGSVTKKIGKKRTAFYGFLLGSFVISFFSFLQIPLFILLDIFCASFFVGFTLPAINGAYADYMSESAAVEKEIEALSDFFTNLGYIVGPILAGFLADSIGQAQAFSFLGVGGILAVIILLAITPRHITVPVKTL